MSKKLTLIEIIEDFKAVHGDCYDYSKVVYKGVNVKIKIICKKHGIFEQTPSIHKQGGECPMCKKIK